MPWIDEVHARLDSRRRTDLLATLQAWWGPLLAMAPTLRAGSRRPTCCCAPATSRRSSSTSPTARCAPTPASRTRSASTSPRELVETVVAERAVDWSNSLFLSCRFRAWRASAFNEYLYNFFKSLSVERMRRAEAEALRKLDPADATGRAEEIALGDYIVERRCPHRNADLTVFGEIDGGELVCTLHGWRFDLETGRCLTREDRPLAGPPGQRIPPASR